MVRRNPSVKDSVRTSMASRIWFSSLILLLCATGVQSASAQCPQFLGTETIAELPVTLTTPHWFQCVSSVTADPSPFNFELTAQP
ncbi:hypothetical protein OAO65_03300, partial [Flavobacteriales bacterium]|nr:hypothetical protein [Flavobacteriales bacterium]